VGTWTRKKRCESDSRGTFSDWILNRFLKFWIHYNLWGNRIFLTSFKKSRQQKNCHQKDLKLLDRKTKTFPWWFYTLVCVNKMLTQTDVRNNTKRLFLDYAYETPWQQHNRLGDSVKKVYSSFPSSAASSLAAASASFFLEASRASRAWRRRTSRFFWASATAFSWATLRFSSSAFHLATLTW